VPEHEPPEVGHAIIALHDVAPEHEAGFHRWYEADHMLAAGTMAPWTIGGMRWEAPAELRALRSPPEGPFGPATRGAFLMLFWIQRDRLAEQQAWVGDAMRDIEATGRTFPARDAVTATTYDYAGHVARDPDGVPPVLALAHHFAGVVLLVAERTPDTTLDDLTTTLLDHVLGPRLPRRARRGLHPPTQGALVARRLPGGRRRGRPAVRHLLHRRRPARLLGHPLRRSR